MQRLVKYSLFLGTILSTLFVLTPVIAIEGGRQMRGWLWKQEGALVRDIVDRCEMFYDGGKGRRHIIEGVFPCDIVEEVKAKRPRNDWSVYRVPYLILHLPGRKIEDDREFPASWFPKGVAAGDAVEVLSNGRKSLRLDLPMTPADTENFWQGICYYLVSIPILSLFVGFLIKDDVQNRKRMDCKPK